MTGESPMTARSANDRAVGPNDATNGSQCSICRVGEQLFAHEPIGFEPEYSVF